MEERAKQQQLLELLKAGQPEDLTKVDTSKVRYALYARKSTTSEDRQASSIEDQIKECMDVVVIPNGLNVVEVYQESVSAKYPDARERFSDMIRDIQMGRIDGVIAWHPDRLSRNMKDAGAIIDLVDRHAIRDLKFKTFTFENTPAGKMLLGITFVMAKQYSEHLSESVGRGNKRATEDGEFIGKFMHGYVIDAQRHLQPDPDNFKLIKHMFNMAIEGKSQKEIRLWINEQNYTVQKRREAEPVPHKWSKDDVSILLHDPTYAGILEWGINYANLSEIYDFEPAITVDDYFKINKIDPVTAKVTSINSPKSSVRLADLFRQGVFCGHCKKSMTSMMLPIKDKETNELALYRYYYKCETEGCPMRNKSARGKVVIDAATKFFSEYLFVTESNYADYVKHAKVNLKKKVAEFDSLVASLRTRIANKQRLYDQAKELIANTPKLSKHYDLDKLLKEIESMKEDYKKAMLTRDSMDESIPSFEEYLKLLQSTPDILGKIRDMKVMDGLLRIFFSNFTITATGKDFRQGSEVVFELKEPWRGFLKNGDFVRGAGTGTLTLDLVLGKDAL
jgi:DNA invertase Pin-like site-specific DNA recombinase